MKPPLTNGTRRTNLRKYQPRTGVTIFLVTIVGSALGLLAGLVIARGAAHELGMRDVKREWERARPSLLRHAALVLEAAERAEESA